MNYNSILQAINDYEAIPAEVIHEEIKPIIATWKATELSAKIGCKVEHVRNWGKQPIKPPFDAYIKIVCVGKNQREMGKGIYRVGKKEYMHRYYEDVLKRRRAEEAYDRD